jgi:hypothetical protein
VYKINRRKHMNTLTLEDQIKAIEAELNRLQEADKMDDAYWDLTDELFRLKKLIVKEPEIIKPPLPEEVLATSIGVDFYDLTKIQVYTLNPNEGKFKPEYMRAISTLPTWTGTLFRGISNRSLSLETVNGLWKPQGISSFSKKFQVAKSFSRGENIIIWKGSGFDIHLVSKHPHEEEVVILSSVFSLSYLRTENYIKYWEATLMS